MQPHDYNKQIRDAMNWRDRPGALDLPDRRNWHCGLLFRPGSLWIGAHWSKYNRRICINLVPMVTFWITLPGGVRPH